jgi:proteasome accessory factor B
LLELSAKVWARASFSVEASRAVMRLKALGMPSEGLELAAFAPRLLTTEPGIMQLEEAARDRFEVSFDYRAPGKDIETRRVQPWQVRHVSGQWLLICFDVEKGAVRNFLLKRITSRVHVSNERFAPITVEKLESAIQDLQEHISRNLAVIKIQPQTEAWVHFEMDAKQPDSANRHEINYMDVHLLADQLRAFGPTVSVVSPPELKDAIRIGLERVVSAHA